jgi:rod shape-determining protein MreC
MGWRSPRGALVACLAIALLLLLADQRGAAPTQALRAAAGAAAGPSERALAWARTAVTERVGAAADERARIAELEQQLAQARAAAAAAAAGTISATAARELAAAAPAQGYRTVPARVVALSTPQDQVRSATIDAGSRDGAAAGLAVLAPEGLVGLVDSVAPGVATVRLVIDPATALASRVASSGEVGVLRGTGQSSTFTLIDPLGRMAVGDLIVTLGTPDGRIPADLPVGRVTAITGSAADLTRSAEVTPAVDDSTVDRLGVLVPEAAP